MSPRKETRLDQLSQALARHHSLHVRDAADLLDVSEMTVRRDIRDNPTRFAFLGGHIIRPDAAAPRAPYDLLAANEVNLAAKRAACAACLPLIQADDTIFVDCGTTLVHLVALIPPDMPLTLICYAMNIADMAMRKPAVRLILLGGAYHAATASFYPVETDPTLERFALNRAFLSAAGLHDSLGASCTTFAEAQVKRAAMARAHRNTLVIDSSKLGQVHPACFAQIQDFEQVVTQDGPMPPIG